AEILSLSPYGETRSTIGEKPLSTEELRRTDAYWRACNYLSLGMIYLLDNPLLAEPLRPAYQEPAAGTLGIKPWTVVYLCSPEPAHQEIRSRHDLPGWSGAWRARRSRS